MKNKILLIALLLSFPLLLNAQGGWSQVANFGGGIREGAVSFCIGDYGYVTTGKSSTNYKNDLWEYDILNNTWTQKANFGGTARSNAVGFAISDKGYVGTGMAYSIYYNDFWEYDPETNIWTQKTNFGGTARDEAVGFSIGNKGYIGTGYNAGYMNDFWEYDPITDVWIEKADFSGTARRDAVGYAIVNKGYIGTGYDGNYKNDFWEYNPVTDIWTQMENFGGTARRDAVGYSLNNKGYIGTGYDGNNYKDDIYEYNPATNSWLVLSSQFIGLPRRKATYFVSSNFVFIGLGYSGALQNNFYRFDPLVSITTSSLETTLFSSDSVLIHFNVTGSFLADNIFTVQLSDTNGSFENPRDIGTITGTNSDTIIALIPSGNYSDGYRIRVVSSNPTVLGTDNGNDIRIVGTWFQKANFGGNGRHCAVGFSIGSKGYIGTGMYQSSSNRMHDFWEYDPVTNIWTQKANFGGTARYYAVGFSIGTKGYIGTGNDGSKRNDFWEYDPVANIWTQKENFGGSARESAVGFSIGTKGYIGTGNDGSKRNDFWEYDPVTNIWTLKANFGGTAREGAIGFSIGTKGYIGTGKSNSSLHNDFWEYDPETNQWTQKENLSGSSRWLAVGFSIADKGYIGTGYEGGYNDLWEYNSLTNTWVQKENTNRRTDEAVGFSIGNKGYIGTGYWGNYNDFWEYSPHLIATKTLSDSSFFQGDSISISYRINKQLDSLITFTAQLSDENGSFTEPLNIDTIQSNSSGLINSSIPLTAYPGDKYRVRVFNSLYNERVFDNGFDISIYTNVQAPALIFPENGNSNQTVTPTFIWNSIDGAINYQIQVSKNIDFLMDEIDFTNITDTTFTSQIVLEGYNLYYWRVSVLTEEGQSGWSTAWNFSTLFGPPKLLNPENNSLYNSIIPTFLWLDAINADSYNFQLSTDEYFSNIILGIYDFSSTSYIDSNLYLNYNTEYYWRVASVNLNEISVWSNYFSFKTIAESPNCLYPDNNACMPINIALKWNSVENAAYYKIQVSNSTDFSSLFYSNYNYSDTTYFLENLPNNIVYYWRVGVVLNDSNYSSWSTARNFITKPAIPNKISPVNYAMSRPINLTFHWQSVPYADSYNLQVSTDSVFSVLIINETELNAISYFASNLSFGTKYYWRVSSTHQGCDSEWSFSSVFTTIFDEPNLLSPADDSVIVGLKPHFFWYRKDTCEFYSFQLSKFSDFSVLLINEVDLVDTSFALESPLSTNSVYYWRVRGSNPITVWSEVWSFTTLPFTIDLSAGWNLISSYVIPFNTNLDSIFSSIMNELVLVKNTKWKVYYPQYSVNLIGNWVFEQGYAVYVQNPVELTILGTDAVPENSPINLTSGWNLVSYLRKNPLSIDLALNSIINNLIIVKNNAGQLYYPAYYLNTIGNMQVGQGYWIYMNAPAVLTYPGN